MKNDLSNATGVLYVVATPIGNLGDMTARAIRVLGEVDLIAAEDTRQTRKLLASFDISTPMISYYKGKEAARTGKVLETLLAGKKVALVSDAGTPAVSDPGAILVRKVLERGIRVEPVPGPSALTAAVSVAGLAETPFIFLGFLPGKKGERQRQLRSLASTGLPLVFYESPRRVVRSLGECRELLGDLPVVIGRELTKLHEEVLRGSLSEIIEDLDGRETVRGEFVVIVDTGGGEEAMASEDPEKVLEWYRDNSGLSMRDAARKIAADLGLSRSEVYNRALRVWKGNKEKKDG